MLKKIKKSLFICLILTALLTIILPMQIEQPLFFFKSIHIDEQMFAQTLVNQREIFNQENMYLAQGQQVTAQRLKQALDQHQPVAQLPTAWVVNVTTIEVEQQAKQMVKHLQAQGLPAFYRQQASSYQVLLGPEVNLAGVTAWRKKVSNYQPDATIQRYLPT